MHATAGIVLVLAFGDGDWTIKTTPTVDFCAAANATTTMNTIPRYNFCQAYVH